MSCLIYCLIKFRKKLKELSFTYYSWIPVICRCVKNWSFVNKYKSFIPKNTAEILLEYLKNFVQTDRDLIL